LLQIAAPGCGLARRTGIVENASAKVFQEFRYVLGIDIDIAVKVTITGGFIGTGVVKGTSPEITQK